MSRAMLRGPREQRPAGAKRMLDGLRVVELATVIAAPCACALLCDHGAEVIKIENPGNPDISRGWGKGDSDDMTGNLALKHAPGGGGSAFIHLNRGKKSLTLDPTRPEGNKILHALLATADIFVTNVRQQSLERMGVDYESLRIKHPRLIYGHLSAWGRNGPKQNDPGYDFGAFWAYTGVMDILRSSEDAPMPRFPGGVGDFTTGSQLFGGILGALYHRERTGEGQLVDAALLRAGVWFLGQAIMQAAGGNSWALNARGPGVRETTELGKRATGITSSPFKCKDGRWIQLMGLEQKRHMPATLRALGLAPEDVFGVSAKAGKATDWVRATRIVDMRMGSKTSDEWGAIFSKEGVWWQKVNRFDGMLNDEQANAADCFVAVPGTRHKVIGTPVIMSKANAIPKMPAPKFGEHTVSVMKNLGLTSEEIQRLKDNHII